MTHDAKGQVHYKSSEQERMEKDGKCNYIRRGQTHMAINDNVQVKMNKSGCKQGATMGTKME